MNWRHYLILFLVGLLVPFGISRFQSLPGYMDADYYFVGGIQLAEGRGFFLNAAAVGKDESEMPLP